MVIARRTLAPTDECPRVPECGVDDGGVIRGHVPRSGDFGQSIEDLCRRLDVAGIGISVAERGRYFGLLEIAIASSAVETASAIRPVCSSAHPRCQSVGRVSAA